MRCGYIFVALAAFVLQPSLAASLPVRPSPSTSVEARCPRMLCRIEEPASAVTPTATFVPAAAATTTAVSSALTPTTSTTVAPSAPAGAESSSDPHASLRAFLAAFMDALKTAVSAMHAKTDAIEEGESSEPLVLASALSDSQESAMPSAELVKRRRAVSLKTFAHHYRVGQTTH